MDAHNTRVEQYKALLKRHNWSFQRSYDHQAYHQGFAERARLMVLQRELDISCLIWNACAPADYRIGVPARAADIVISGPPGCGKTRNADALAKAYGKTQVVDDWSPGTSIPPNAIALTCVRGLSGAIEFAEAMRFARSQPSCSPASISSRFA